MPESSLDEIEMDVNAKSYPCGWMHPRTSYVWRVSAGLASKCQPIFRAHSI